MKKLLADLISIKSYSGKEKAIASYIFSFFKEKGAEVFMQDQNVVVHISKGSKTAVIFNAHMDTVEVQDIASWHTDPFTLSETKDRYFGLGVSDEKVSIAILMELYQEFISSKIDIFLVFVANEEIDGAGSKSFADYFQKKHGYEKAYCIICEPRNAKYLGIGNKGNIFFEFTQKGISCHASEAKKGDNAIMGLMKKVPEIFHGFEKFKEEEEDANLGFPTIAYPTVIKGGSSVNTVPDTCIAYGDIRTTPKTHEMIKGYINGFKEVKIISETKAYVNKDKVLLGIFAKLGIKYKRCTAGSNDAVFFGDIGISSVVFGAGNEEACHISNEFCEMKNIEKTKRIYLGLVEQLTYS
ncbi:MAG: M20/M25/M40 family metallo-hydrolase [Candidatus Woesearchaeota archaeon]|nr:M20/M25/M40 family metallo-hydrolase [Candidatus Woesearchaeota archaeon]